MNFDLLYQSLKFRIIRMHDNKDIVILRATADGWKPDNEYSSNCIVSELFTEIIDLLNTEETTHQ